MLSSASIKTTLGAWFHHCKEDAAAKQQSTARTMYTHTSKKKVKCIRIPAKWKTPEAFLEDVGSSLLQDK